MLMKHTNVYIIEKNEHRQMSSYLNHEVSITTSFVLIYNTTFFIEDKNKHSITNDILK